MPSIVPTLSTVRLVPSFTNVKSKVDQSIPSQKLPASAKKDKLPLSTNAAIKAALAESSSICIPLFVPAEPVAAALVLIVVVSAVATVPVSSTWS